MGLSQAGAYAGLYLLYNLPSMVPFFMGFGEVNRPGKGLFPKVMICNSHVCRRLGPGNLHSGKM
jgi:hypothetical protein